MHPSIDDALYPLLFFVSFCRATHAHSTNTQAREQAWKIWAKLDGLRKKRIRPRKLFFLYRVHRGVFCTTPPLLFCQECLIGGIIIDDIRFLIFDVWNNLGLFFLFPLFSVSSFWIEIIGSLPQDSRVSSPVEDFGNSVFALLGYLDVSAVIILLCFSLYSCNNYGLFLCVSQPPSILSYELRQGLFCLRHDFPFV